jgi:energy-coupling factor transport system substrate-specific component
LRLAPRLFALVPAAVAINLVTGGIVKELSLPVYLDTIGTVMIAVLTGAWPAILVGTLSQLLLGLLTGYQYLPFVVIQWLLATLVAMAARHHGFASYARATASGLVAGALCGTASAVISYTLFRGSTGGGVSWITAALRSTGMPLTAAVTISSSSTDLVDKTIVVLVTATVLRNLPRRVLARFPLARQATTR